MLFNREKIEQKEGAVTSVKVSIIVPVYNVEEYLAVCLESLIHQTLSDIEIIIVNDGATDGSQRIIDHYQSKTNKIKAYSKTNGGLSDARNYGLTFATGEYIGFVDSDDFVEPDMYEILYNKAQQDRSDIVECNLRHTFADKEDIEIGKKIQDRKELLMFGRSVVWNKIYKKEWLLQTKVEFPKGLIYEDIEFFIKLIPHIRVYSYVDAASIHYVQRSTSLNHFASVKTLDILNILERILAYYKEQGYLEEYQEAMELFFARIILCSSFKRICKINNRSERQGALKKNWDFLIQTFPNWRKNPVLRRMNSHKSIFMKTVNKTTYQWYGWLFSFLFFIRNSKRKVAYYEWEQA